MAEQLAPTRAEPPAAALLGSLELPGPSPPPSSEPAVPPPRGQQPQPTAQPTAPP
jgi:hypothetical protein